MVDENGEPLVVYHGTTEKFNVFLDEKIGSRTDEGFAGRGFYFSPVLELAEEYASHEMVATFINARNPYILKSDDWGKLSKYGGPNSFSLQLKKQGYDGVITEMIEVIRDYEEQMQLSHSPRIRSSPPQTMWGLSTAPMRT
ncbi:MAG: hypothetical protein MJ215_04185 [Spirochaetia bacterium]|nr:hypothetical protein [Spirochaetia bacterium]